MHVVQPLIFQPDIADPHYSRRYAHGGAVRVNGMEQYGVGGDLAVVAYPHGAQHLGAAAYHDIASQRGVALAGVLAGAAQCNTLIQRAAVAHLGGFPDDDTGAMINKNAVPDDGAGVDLNTGKKTSELADEPRQKETAMPVQPVCRAVPEQGVYTGIHQQYFKAGTGYTAFR